MCGLYGTAEVPYFCYTPNSKLQTSPTARVSLRARRVPRCEEVIACVALCVVLLTIQLLLPPPGSGGPSRPRRASLPSGSSILFQAAWLPSCKMVRRLKGHL